MDKVEDMNSFFTFLHEHIEKGEYQNMKDKYSVLDFELSAFKKGEYLDEDGTYTFEPREYGDYIGVSTRYANGQDGEIILYKNFIEYFSVNPKKLSYKKKIVFSDSGEIYEEIEDCYYDDLVNLYKSKLGMLKKCFANSLMKDVTDANRNSFNEGMLLKLNYFLELVDSQDYVVTAQDGTTTNLLLNFLQDSVNWVQKKRLSGTLIKQDNIIDSHELNLDNKLNKFNGMPLEEVNKHFEVLKSKSKKGNQHLTEEQFNRFFSIVFIEGGNLIEDKIEMRMGNREISKIRRVFYNFYVKSRESFSYEREFQSKEKYVKLLTDNFSNFEYHHSFKYFNK